MPRIGLVLGAGGSIGYAFHAGVLAALAQATGWDPRTAEVVVGTSAGSVTAGMLRAGLGADEVFARVLDEPPSRTAVRLARRFGASRMGRPNGGRRRLGSASPALLARSALRPWRVRPGIVAAAALPAGRITLAPMVAAFDAVFRDEWPEEALWIAAVRLDNGRRVLFGCEDAPRPAVATAIAASCAIPGLYEPIEIDGVRHVDGGAHSPTNADALAGLGLDLVVVSSPMSTAPTRTPRLLDFAPRTFFRAQLAREVARLRAHGTPVLAFAPTPADLRAMGLNALDEARRPRVACTVRESALRRLESARLAGRVATLAACAAGRAR